MFKKASQVKSLTFLFVTLTFCNLAIAQPGAAGVKSAGPDLTGNSSNEEFKPKINLGSQGTNQPGKDQVVIPDYVPGQGAPPPASPVTSPLFMGAGLVLACLGVGLVLYKKQPKK